jgi:hypothetical protein
MTITTTSVGKDIVAFRMDSKRIADCYGYTQIIIVGTWNSIAYHHFCVSNETPEILARINQVLPVGTSTGPPTVVLLLAY